MSMRQNNTAERIGLGAAVVIRWLADYTPLIISGVIGAAILYIAVSAFLTDPQQAVIGTLAIMTVLSVTAIALWGIGTVAEREASRE